MTDEQDEAYTAAWIALKALAKAFEGDKVIKSWAEYHAADLRVQLDGK